MAGVTYGPAMYKHVERAYKALEKSAKQEHIPQLRRSILVFEGYATKVMTRAIPPSYYSPVMKVLVTMGCVRQNQRGTYGTPSILFLLKEPNEKDFAQAVSLIDTKKFKKETRRELSKRAIKKVAAP